MAGVASENGTGRGQHGWEAPDVHIWRGCAVTPQPGWANWGCLAPRALFWEEVCAESLQPVGAPHLGRGWLTSSVQHTQICAITAA